ncbi:MAG: hypothetical protein AABN34_21610 [Acidobacteriota bacterium]
MEVVPPCSSARVDPVFLQNADRALDSIALPVPAQIKLDAWLLEANREILFT